MARKDRENQKADRGASRSPSAPRHAEKGLGKGLKALLSDRDAAASLGLEGAEVRETMRSDRMVAIEKIEPNRWQPRRRFDQGELAELAGSIARYGILQPLLVRPHPERAEAFELIAGERRWRASQIAAIHEVPVIIRSVDESQTAEIALIENIQRQDLNAIEEAEGYKQLVERFGHTQEGLAAIVGKSRSHLANSMRLLKLPAEVREMLASGALNAGQVRPLVGHEDAINLAHHIAARRLNARQAEALASSSSGKTRKKPETDPDTRALAKELTENLGLAVTLDFNRQSEKGKIIIRVNSLDQFDEVLEKLTK